MEDTRADMTATVFIRSYRSADCPVDPQARARVCAEGDAALKAFLEKMPRTFAEDAALCALLVKSHRLAQTQHGSFRVYLDGEQRCATVHITSVFYLIAGECLQLFRSIAAHADCVILRKTDGENGETYFSVRKDLA